MAMVSGSVVANHFYVVYSQSLSCRLLAFDDRNQKSIHIVLTDTITQGC